MKNSIDYTIHSSEINTLSNKVLVGVEIQPHMKDIAIKGLVEHLEISGLADNARVSRQDKKGSSIVVEVSERLYNIGNCASYIAEHIGAVINPADLLNIELK